MPETYESLVRALKALTRGEAPDTETLPMAENGWNTRPDTVSYGIVNLDFETTPLYGDNVKQDTAHEGSLDLFSRKKDGDGWIPMITETLTEHCEGCWSLNYHTHETESNLFHWEWVFEVEG